MTRRLTSFGFLGLLLACGALALPLRFNLSGSVPGKLFWLRSKPPERGDLIVICLPRSVSCFGRGRGYLAAFGPCPCGAAPALKLLAGLPGDEIEITEDRTSLNGIPLPCSGRRRRDSAGRLLTRLAPGRYAVPPNHLWLYSGLHPASWDSRYYGAVPTSGLQGIASPVFP